MVYRVNPSIGFATLPFGLGRVRGGQEISTDKDLSVLVPHVLQVVEAPQATPFGAMLPDPADPGAVPTIVEAPPVAAPPSPAPTSLAPIAVLEPEIAPAGPSETVGFDTEIGQADVLDPTRQSGDLDVESALQAVRQGQGLPEETIDDILGPEDAEEALPSRTGLSKPLPSSQPRSSKRGKK